MLIDNSEKITVRHLVQWSTCHDLLGRLRINDDYPRREHSSCSITAGKYLLKIMHNTDDDLLVFNMKEHHATIVDGASRVATLVRFQQGLMSMAVPFGDLPDNIKCREYEPVINCRAYEPVMERKMSQDRHKHDLQHFHKETMVEAFYSDMKPEVQEKFLTAKLTVLKLEDLSDVQEASMHFDLNGCRPTSPQYQSNYSEADELKKVCGRLFSSDAQHLNAIMGYISGSMASVARCELLRLLTKVLDDADEAAMDDHGKIGDVGKDQFRESKRSRFD